MSSKIGWRMRRTFKELNNLAQRADCLLGHNLVRHDLPVLRERAPDLPIHRLPVIDTLMLSPICFPENPYHRLVKDYNRMAAPRPRRPLPRSCVCVNWDWVTGRSLPCCPTPIGNWPRYAPWRKRPGYRFVGSRNGIRWFRCI